MLTPILAAVLLGTTATQGYLFYKLHKLNKMSNEISKQHITTLESILKNREDITSIYKTLNKMNRVQAKFNSLIKEAKSGLADSFKAIQGDMDGLYQISETLTGGLKKLMERHNNFADYTHDVLEDIWCELQEGDCSDCPMREACRDDGENDDLDDTEIPEDSCITQRDLDDADIRITSKARFSPDGKRPSGTLTIDPRDESNLDKLKDTLLSSGVPQNVVDQYMDQVRDIVKTNKAPFVVKWDSFPVKKGSGTTKSNVPPLHPTPETGKKSDSNKMIDPNSKIVKTLNRLLEQ